MLQSQGYFISSGLFHQVHTQVSHPNIAKGLEEAGRKGPLLENLIGDSLSGHHFPTERLLPAKGKPHFDQRLNVNSRGFWF